MTGERSRRDTIYAELASPGDFVFDETVVAVFDDMISRSVPGYRTTLTTIATLAAQHVQPGTRLYDLGCSLGAASLASAAALPVGFDCEIVAVDTAAAMLESWQSEARTASVPIRQVCADIREMPMSQASFVVLNFTLQFIPVPERHVLLEKIFAACIPGACLVLSEKITDPDPATNAQLIELHHRFKKAHGYSDLEISRKRAALEKVLIPETIDDHLSRLTQAGFQRAYVWYQCFNFVSIVAFK